MADNKIQVNAKADTLETDASKKKKEDKKEVFKPFGKRTSFLFFSKLKLLTRTLASFKCK